MRGASRKPPVTAIQTRRLMVKASACTAVPSRRVAYRSRWCTVRQAVDKGSLMLVL